MRPRRSIALSVLVLLTMSLGALAPVDGVLAPAPALAEDGGGSPALPSAYYIPDTTDTDVQVFINGEELEFDFSGFTRYSAAAPDFMARRFTRIDGTRFLLRIEAPAEMAGYHVGVDLIVCDPPPEDDPSAPPDCGSVAVEDDIANLIVADECDADPDDAPLALKPLVDQDGDSLDGRLGFVMGVLTDGVFDCVLDLAGLGANGLSALGLAIEIGPELEDFRQASADYLGAWWPTEEVDGQDYYQDDIDELDTDEDGENDLDELVLAAGCEYLNESPPPTAAQVLAAWFGDGGLQSVLDCPSGRVDITHPASSAYNQVVWSSEREFLYAEDFEAFVDQEDEMLDLLLLPCADAEDVGPCVETGPSGTDAGWDVVLRNTTHLSGWDAQLQTVLRRNERAPKATAPRQGYGILAGDQATVVVRLPRAEWADSLVRPFMNTAAAVLDYGVTVEDDHVRFAMSFEARNRSVALSTTAEDECDLEVDSDVATPSDCDVPDTARRISELRLRPIAYATATGSGGATRVTTAADYWRAYVATCDPDAGPGSPDECIEIPGGPPTTNYDTLRDACGFPERFDGDASYYNPASSTWVTGDPLVLGVPLHDLREWSDGSCDLVRADPSAELIADWPKDDEGARRPIGSEGGPDQAFISDLLSGISTVDGKPVVCYGYAEKPGEPGEFYDALDLEQALLVAGGGPTVLDVTFCAEQTRVTYVAVSDGFGGTVPGPGCEGVPEVDYCPPVLVPVTGADGLLLPDLPWTPTFALIPDPNPSDPDPLKAAPNLIRTEAIVEADGEGASYVISATPTCLDADGDDECDYEVAVAGVSDDPSDPFLVPVGAHVLVLTGRGGDVPSFVDESLLPAVGDTVVPVGVDLLVDGTELTLAAQAFTNRAFVIDSELGEDLADAYDLCVDGDAEGFDPQRNFDSGFHVMCESDASDRDGLRSGVMTVVTASPHGLGDEDDVLSEVHLSLLGTVLDGFYSDALITGPNEIEVVVPLSLPMAYSQERAGVVVAPDVGEDPRIIVSDAPLQATLYGLSANLGTLAGGFVATNGQRFSFGTQLVDPFAEAFDFALAGPSVDAGFRSRSSGAQKDGFFQAYIPAAHVDSIFGLTVAQAAARLQVDRLDRADSFGVAASSAARGLGSGLLVSGTDFGFSAPYFSLVRGAEVPQPPAPTESPVVVPPAGQAVLLPGGEPPALPPGTGSAVVNGALVDLVVASTPTGSLVLEVPGLEIVLDPTSALGSSLAVVDGQPVLQIEQGGGIAVDALGFQPGTPVYVWLFSEPQLLAVLATDAEGRLVDTIPFDGALAGRAVSAGVHTLQIVGSGSDGAQVAVNLGVRITRRPTRSATSAPADDAAATPPAAAAPAAPSSPSTAQEPPATPESSAATDSSQSAAGASVTDSSVGAGRRLGLLAVGLAALLAAYGTFESLRRRRVGTTGG